MPYNGIGDCARRTIAAEGVGSFWRGNLANVIRYFPTQALNFAFKDTVKAMFAVSKDASTVTKFATNIACVGIFIYRGMYFGLYDSIKPLLPYQSVFINFALGWCVTTIAGMGGYPIDTVRRRMMMTAGTGVKYNGSIDCARQVIKNEGVKSLFKGAGANVMRGMGGAAVLAGFDVLVDFYKSLKAGN